MCVYIYGSKNTAWSPSSRWTCSSSLSGKAWDTVFEHKDRLHHQGLRAGGAVGHGAAHAARASSRRRTSSTGEAATGRCRRSRSRPSDEPRSQGTVRSNNCFSSLVFSYVMAILPLDGQLNSRRRRSIYAGNDASRNKKRETFGSKRSYELRVRSNDSTNK
jgi:hypothetical protein